MVFFWSSLKYWDHRHVSPCRHSMPFCDWVTSHYIDRLQWVHGHFGCFYLWLLGIMLLQTLMHFVYGRTFSIPLGVDSQGQKNHLLCESKSRKCPEQTKYFNRDNTHWCQSSRDREERVLTVNASAWGVFFEKIKRRKLQMLRKCQAVF